MSQLHISAVFRIKNDQLDAFKLIVRKCVSIVKDKDSGTLQYDWFFSADQSVCVIMETYTDSDAFMEHMGNLGDTMGELLAICDFEANLYGSPSEQVMTALDGLPIKHFSHFAGL